MLDDLIREYEDIIKKDLNINPAIVPGEGKMDALIMLVGEAPGGEEERMGKPFVGAAGKNLDKFLNVLNIERSEIYITNVVKFRPFKLSEKTGKKINRTPNQKEINVSYPILKKEIYIIKPRIIVTLGNTPLRAVTGDKSISIGDVHGTVMNAENTLLFPLYHPASVIYNQKLYDVYNEDLLKLKSFIENGFK